jgi:hypothetical protein
VINFYLKKAFSMPPQKLAKKVINKIHVKLKNKLQRSKDLNQGTHINFNFPIIKNSYIDIDRLDVSNIDSKVAQHLSQMYIEHRFDLLGSGWVQNSYNSAALGVEGYKYNMNVPAPESIANEYEPIDWQKDFKSGYRWNDKIWYKDIEYGNILGVDIKVPWELSRLQHLPQLAIFSLVDNNLQEQNLREFKYQILDFITNNPPRMGVNWVCTMDVGIRAANMLVAYDLFCQIDDFEILDDDFKQVFANSIYEHGLHIINNLEYSESLTSNHYLSDIAGLLYISAYLTSNARIDKWLAFSIQEIMQEMQNEFYEDGGNFESSTSYHRLSGELMIYSTALILGLKKDKIKSLQDYTIQNWNIKPKLKSIQNQQFSIESNTLNIDLPQWYIDKLYKIGRFTYDISKPNGEIPQFGDNDSGRFFRLSPNGEFITYNETVNKYLNLKNYGESDTLFWDENILNHTTFISCFSGLYQDEIFKNSNILEKSFICAIADKILTEKNKEYVNININNTNIKELKYTKSIEYDLISNIQDLNFIVYPNSGIYIFKADNVYLSICVTPLGQKDNGGHTHNDKLGFELWANGKNVVEDPGTYLYTPIADRRNEFRSLKAHNVPAVQDIEQNTWLDGRWGLFSLNKNTSCFVNKYDNNSIQLELNYKNIQIIREFKIENNKVIIIDKCNKKFQYNNFKFYSNGYGKLLCKK